MNTDFIPDDYYDDDEPLPVTPARPRTAAGTPYGPHVRPYRDRRPPPLRRAYSERGKAEFISPAPMQAEPKPEPAMTANLTAQGAPRRRRWFPAFFKIALVETLGTIFVAMVASGNKTMMTIGIVGLVLDVPLAYILVPVAWFLPFIGRTVVSTPVTPPEPATIPWGSRPPLTSEDAWNGSAAERQRNHYQYAGGVA